MASPQSADVCAEVKVAGATALPIAILGVPFDPMTTETALACLDEMVSSGRPHQVATANVDFLVQAQSDAELKRVLLKADLVLCDGMPLVWASYWLGNRLPERIAGSDLVPLLIEQAARRKHRLYLLGATPEANDRAAANVAARWPGVVIAGRHAPPFQPLEQWDHHAIIQRVREARPDILLVAFGCPKAEKWIAAHLRELAVPVVMGVGATIDFLAGRMPRAPRWMQRCGLEWMFRLLQEPRRLAGRYARDFWHFGRAASAQWWRMGILPGGRSRPFPSWRVIYTRHWQRVEPGAWLDRRGISSHGEFWNNVAKEGRHCLLDLSGVRFMDATGVAVLARLEHHFSAGNRLLVLQSPSVPARRALRAAQLEGAFRIVVEPLEAARFIAPRDTDRPLHVNGRGVVATARKADGPMGIALSRIPDRHPARLAGGDPPSNPLSL